MNCEGNEMGSRMEASCRKREKCRTTSHSLPSLTSSSKSSSYSLSWSSSVSRWADLATRTSNGVGGARGLVGVASDHLTTPHSLLIPSTHLCSFSSSTSLKLTRSVTARVHGTESEGSKISQSIFAIF